MQYTVVYCTVYPRLSFALRYRVADCAAVYESGHRHSGVYYVKPGAAACPVPVWCDMDTTPGGWLLFQRRQDGSVNFTRNWAQYRDGFGHVAGEHWLGNDNLFLLTNQVSCVDLEGVQGGRGGGGGGGGGLGYWRNGQ